MDSDWSQFEVSEEAAKAIIDGSWHFTMISKRLMVDNRRWWKKAYNWLYTKAFRKEWNDKARR